jgi:epoxide hydrolase-like predicted phosphatase
MGIHAILFDFVGVLLQKKGGHAPDTLADEIDRLVGQVTDDALFQRQIAERFGLDQVALDKILARVVDKYEAFQPLWKLIPQLRERYRLAIINNGTALTLPLFRARYAIDERFLFVSSAMEGIRKPDPRIFSLTTELLGVAPEECLFMDDSAQNVESAARLGMETIHWPDAETGWQAFRAWRGRQEG